MAKVVGGQCVMPSWWAVQAVKVAEVVRKGYDYDPGDGDLDNEQPIHVRMTLADYRRAVQLSNTKIIE
jgi:hypothetical protein